MKNRWLLNLALVLLVAVMLAIVVYRPGTPPEPPVTALTALDTDAITRLRVQRPHLPEIVVEKSSGEWVVTAPRRGRANLFRVNELLRLATAKSASHFVAPSADLVKYGLDQPQARVWLNDSEIRFGSAHPISPQHYVLVAGQVYLIGSNYFFSATVGPMDFFSAQLLEDKRKPIAFTLPAFKLSQESNGTWQVTPANKELASDRINTFVDEWRHAQALSVSPYSGKPAHENVHLVFAPDSPVKDMDIGILAHKPELILYRKDEGLEYHFPEDVGARLLELKPE